MKRSMMIVSAVCFAVWCSASNPAAAALPGMSLKLAGGFSNLRIGDTNTNITELVRNWRNAAGVRGFGIDGALEKLESGREGEFEILIPMRRFWAVGIGAGRILAERNGNRMEMALPPPIWHQLQNQDSRISAIPVFVDLYYFRPVVPRVSFFAKLGAGYYSVKWHEWGRYDAESEGVAPWWREWELDAASGGLGFQGGVGFEIRIVRRLALSVEGFGRACSISDFTGKGTVRRSWEAGVSRYPNSTLYYYEWKDALTSDWYSDVNLRQDVPGGDTERNGRKADVDLGGFGFRAGFVIRFR
jgi:hypothetical protein